MTESPATTFYERVERAIEQDPPSARDIWRRLTDLVDPAQFRPKLAPDIEKKVQRLRWGNDYAVIQNPRDQIHILLTPQDLELLDLMDGTRTVKEIVFERFQEKGSLELESVADMVRSLYEANFLEQRYFDADAAVKDAMDPASTARRKARTFARTLSISWNGADRLVQWLYRRGLKIFFNRGVLALTAVVSVVGFVAFVDTAGSHRFSLAGKSLAYGFLLLLLLDYVMVFVHELGDAIDVPDLRPRSLRFLRHDFLHKLRKREKWTKQEFGLASYAILGTIFTVFSFYTAYFFWETIFG